MERHFNWFRWYTPRVRIMCHIAFWLVMTFFYFLTYRRVFQDNAWLFVLKDLFVVSTIFYFTTAYVVNQWLLKRKFILVLLWAISTYIWWLLMTYIACWFSEKFLPVPERDEYWNFYLNIVLNKGLWSLFLPENIPIFILDFIYVISFPLAPKLMKSLSDQSYKSTKLELDNLDYELKFLKSQISPHFLFNMLNNIYQMVKKQEPDASATILRLADMLRYILYRTKQEKILLTHEINFLRGYIELARIRYTVDFPLTVDIQEPDEPYTILPLVLLPFVENAFKHGPDRSQHNCWITIILRIESDVLTLIVENGVNHDAPKHEDGGEGQKNVKRRLALNYPDRHELDIRECEKSYHVKLTLNLNENGLTHLHSRRR